MINVSSFDIFPCLSWIRPNTEKCIVNNAFYECCPNISRITMTKWRNKSNCNIVTQRYKRLPHFNTRSLEQLKREGKHTSTLWTQRTIMAPDFFRDVKCILQLLSCQPGDLGEGPDLHWTDSWGRNWSSGNSSIVVEFYKAKLWNMCEWDYQVGRAKSSKESSRWTVGKLD